MKKITTHHEQLAFLKKIEGQVRGVQKMIEDGRYCVDIMTQLHSIVGAILRVEDKVFRRHIEGCVGRALSGKSDVEKHKKMDELMELIKKFRRGL